MCVCVREGGREGGRENDEEQQMRNENAIAPLGHSKRERVYACMCVCVRERECMYVC